MKIPIVVDSAEGFYQRPPRYELKRAIISPMWQRRQKYTARRTCFTLDTHPAELHGDKRRASSAGAAPIEGTEGHAPDNAIAAAVDGIPASRIIRKPTFGSVGPAGYAPRVPEPPTEIEFVGVCTGICVISNAMLCKAAFLEANIVIDGTLRVRHAGVARHWA